MTSEFEGRYHGRGGALFALYLKTSLLTLLTLGIYRFWARTRIRRYIWSATSGDGDSFEYTGTGLEKFLGFLLAVVILAIYLGLVQMVLFYFGIFLFDEPTTQAEALLQSAGVYLTLVAVLPLIFFARYRARRYRMARTRWRGLRFGMEQGAWGYAGRAVLHLLLVILTLGILLPHRTFWLEKFMVDRTWYGDAQFVQHGKWTGLYPGMKHLAFGAAILVGGPVAAVLADARGLFGVALILGGAWIAVGFVHYRIYSFNYLTRNKVLDGKVAFRANVRTRDILKIYVVAALAMVGTGLVFGAVVSVVLASFVAFLGGSEAADLQALASGAGVGATIAFIVLYVLVFLLFGAISMVLITQRSIACFVQSVAVENASHLEQVRQRMADAGTDAEGFAEALDIGGAI